MDVDQGTLPTLRAGFDPEVKSGEFYGPANWMHWRGYPVAHDAHAKAHDTEAAGRLWEMSENLTGVSFENRQSEPSNS